MVLDHSHEILADLFNEPLVADMVRYPGRIAFPLFVFLIVDGFFKTSSKSRYMFRMFIGGLVMSIGSLFLVCVLYSNTEINQFWEAPNFLNRLFFPIKSNIFWTLGLGLLALFLIHKIKEKTSDHFVLSSILILVLVMSLLADYSYIAPLLFINFYFFYDHKYFAVTCLAILSFLLLSVDLTESTNFWAGENSQWAMILAIPFMIKYNGKKGRRDMKYFFYIFYPVHLWVIFAVEYYRSMH